MKKIADITTDEKSRPLKTVLISHCGELELRKVPAKADPRTLMFTPYFTPLSLNGL